MAEDLRRFLLRLPAQDGFECTEDTRRLIRLALFTAVSSGGDYLSHLFPRAFPGPGPHRAAEKVANDFDWRFANYYRELGDNLHRHRAYHGGLPCARIFRKGEPVYRCLTCGFDDTCALCSYCYQPEHHADHKVHITICQRENGGVCDCGDPEAWVRPILCPYAAGEALLGPLPEELALSFVSTVEILLDFVIDVMCQDELHFYLAWDASTPALELFLANCTLDPAKYGFSLLDSPQTLDPNPGRYYLVVYNDQVRHYRDAVQRIHLASKKVPQFAAMVTDKVQNYGRAKVIRSSNLQLLQERQKILSATGLASCIRSERDVFREDMCDEILVWINDFTESDVFRTNSRIKNLFCRAFAGKWRKGLLAETTVAPEESYCQGKLDGHFFIPKVPSEGGHNKKTPHWFFDPSLWQLPELLCNECDYNTSTADYDLSCSHLGSRFQYLVYLDIRFWKSIRTLLHEMYSTSLITNLCYKNVFCCQYVDIYPTIADMFLTIDREPELNIMCTLSTQLFTCPSNSTSIVQHGDVSRIFASIYGFLSTGKIESPDTVRISHEISMTSLKNRRWGQIFFDIGYILSRSRDSRTVLNYSIIPMACDILALFQGRPVMKRESKTHVEYESPDYTAFFHAILVIYQFANYIACCITTLKEVSPEEKRRLSSKAITYVVSFLLRLENNDFPGLLDESVDINLATDKDVTSVIFDGHAIQKFRIDEDKVSFLHPIHSFLSWLIELSDFQSAGEINALLAQETTEKDTAGSVISKADSLTSIIDYPLRTIVLMSQIKSGFWVRNGFSVKTRLQLYRNTGLRESGYMRDVFLIQSFIASNKPDLVCYLLFNRWLLFDGWITGPSTTSNELAYDPSTLTYMLDECLSFFIHVMSEDLNLRSLSNEKINELRIKNEIIHNLCFGPMNYSKLCSQIPDHITSEKRFDLILQEMTIFSPPTNSKDIGIYKLKEEYFDEVNPYYFNYTTNTKDDAIKFVKERIHKRTSRPTSEIVVIPKIREPTELGIYKYIGNFSVSTYFSDFIIRTLMFIAEQDANKVDSLLETTLHLIHICSIEQNVDIDAYGTFYEKFVGVSQVYRTSIIALLYRILRNDDFKDHHSKVRFIFRAFEKKYHDLNKMLSQQGVDFHAVELELNTLEEPCESESERKKRIAKERQARLMAKFKKQQSLFLKHNHMEQHPDCMSDVEMEDYEEEIGWKFPEPHCILCQNASEDAGPFGIIVNISKSSEFRDVPFDDDYWFMKAFSDKTSLDEDENGYPSEIVTDRWSAYMKKIKENNVVGPGFSNQKNVNSKLVSLTCGHGMHFQCYINFVNGIRNRLNQITRNTPENVEHKEFLCPLCKAINNMFIPILWTSNKKSLKDFLQPLSPEKGSSHPLDTLHQQHLHNEDWFRSFAVAANTDIEDFSILSLSAIEMIGQSSTDNTPTVNQQHFRMLLSNMFQILSLLTFPQIFKADSTNVLVNSIKSTEIGLRGVLSSGQLVIHQISNNTLVNLRTWSEFRNTSLLIKVKNWILMPHPKADSYVKLLANFLVLSTESFNVSIMERDFFELLVSAFPLPRSGFLFHDILEACFVGHIIQSLYIITSELVSRDFYMGLDYSLLDVPVSSEVSDEDAELALLLFKRLVNCFPDSTAGNEAVINHPRFGSVLFTMVAKTCTPFLRRALIFAFVSCAEIENLDIVGCETAATEADKLCRVMNLTGIKETLKSFFHPGQGLHFGHRRFNNFLHHLKKTQARASPSEEFSLRKALEYPGLIKLTDLPERLDFFFTNYYYLDKYNNPHMAIEDPAICLFCSEVVDTQKSSIGCKEGQCTTHFLKDCANNVGIFLLPKERSILLLHKNGGSFYDAPFLDHHGELSGEAKKGKALYLMKERYDEFIRNVWLQHNVSNYIVRKLDSVIDAGGWDTL